MPCSRLTRVRILLHESCCSGNAHKSHQLHGSELPHNPICIFLKSPDLCPMFQSRGKCTSSSGSVYQQGMWQGSQDLASWPPVVSTVCQRSCCGHAGSTRLHTMGKSNINWAACLQEAEAALEESSPTVQRARSEIWFLGSPCCSDQETSVSGSLGKTGLPGEYVVKSTAGFAKQVPKVQQLGCKKEPWSQVSLGLPSWLAGRHALLTL